MALKQLLPSGCFLALLATFITPTLAQTAGVCSSTNKTAGVCSDRPPAGTYQCATDGSICCSTSVPGYTCPVCGAVFFKPSVQYGCAGEQWQPTTSRLLDYSYAGYRSGADPIPSPPISADLKLSYGAKGDGKTDDTQALLDAVDDAVDQVTVIYLPPGRYLLSKRVDISKRVILRGAGRNLTTIAFAKSLSALGANWTGNSPYTYGPALLNWWGTGKTDANSLIAKVTRNATRGSTRLYVSSTASFSTSTVMRLLMDNINNQLLADQNGGLTVPDPGQNNRADFAQFNFKVLQVGPDFVDFDRPLAFNVSTAWSPEIHSWAPYLRTDCGIEKLTVEMPWTPFPGWNKEEGWNAINFWWTPNGWIDDVSILNADLGVIIDGSPFFTAQNLQIGVTKSRGSYDGSWGVWVKNAADVLVTRFNISGVYFQDIAVQAGASSTVISNGVGRNLSINPLYGGPYGILVSNVDFGTATNPYGLSGALPKVSSFFTLWNVKSAKPLTQPRSTYGPRMNWVGARLAPFTDINATLQWYIENNNTVTWPVDLADSQLDRRMAPQTTTTPFGPGYGCDPVTSRICCIGFSNSTCPACPQGYGLPSKLWGCQGELADTAGKLGAQRLLDWSYAGYMAGEMPIPRLPVVASIMDFGAVGDGVADDTSAFLEAITAIGRQGTLFLPAGRYLIRKQLNINNRVVLRGEGPAKTRLVFSKPLKDVLGNTTSYTYGPGYIQFNGANWFSSTVQLATVTADAARGQGVLRVSDSTQFTPGQWVRLVLNAPAAGGIVTNMTMGIVPETADYKNKASLLSFNSRVSFVGVGFIKLERDLPYNVSVAWKPTLYDFDTSLPRQQVGVEDLTIEFPQTPYKGWGTEAGYNGVYFWSTAHCWVRNVAIINADMGVAFDGTYFCSVDNLQLISGNRGVSSGAWGVWIKNGADMLVKNLNAQARMVRDITVQGLQPGTAIVNSTGTDLSIQTIAAGPYGLLLSNVDVGYGSRPWGQVGTVQSASSFMTVWNLDSQVKMPAPYYLFAPLMNFVGFNGSDPTSISAYKWYVEATRAQVFPLDLYAAQLFARIGAIPPVDSRASQVTYTSPGYGCDGWCKCLVGTSNATMPKCPAVYSSPSKHFGCAGELWNPAGRLPADWSFAGYKNGDASLPDIPVVASVRDYGAKGDNKTDDTAAFLAALADPKITNGTILIPAGVYRITKTLDTRKSVVLRGAGKSLTTLYFPYSLSDVYGNTWSEGGAGSNVSDYAHGTGFINWWGWDPVAPDRTYVTDVTAAASRGATVLYVATTAKLKVNMWVRINLDDPGKGELVKDLSGGYMRGGPNQAGARSLVRHLSRISEMGTNWIRLERPMITNISLAYKPQVHSFQPLITNAGIEHLTIAFPTTKYPGHLMEAGYNAIHFNQVAQSWVRNVRIHNSDSAFYSWGMVFCTITGLEVSSGDRGYDNGHRGIWLERGQDNLIVDFNFTTKMYHDLSVSFYEHSTAFVNGTGKDINMDHHRAAPHSILWSNINTGINSRTFESSGDGAGNGNHSASFITFWNIKGRLNALLPEPDFGPNLNFINLKTEDWVSSPYNWVLEKPPAPFSPVDLYSAQKLTRAARLKQPPQVVKQAGVCAVTTVAAAKATVAPAPPASPAAASTPKKKRLFFL